MTASSQRFWFPANQDRFTCSLVATAPGPSSLADVGLGLNLLGQSDYRVGRRVARRHLIAHFVWSAPNVKTLYILATFAKQLICPPSIPDDVEPVPKFALVCRHGGKFHVPGIRAGPGAAEGGAAINLFLPGVGPGSPRLRDENGSPAGKRMYSGRLESESNRDGRYNRRNKTNPLVTRREWLLGGP